MSKVIQSEHLQFFKELAEKWSRTPRPNQDVEEYQLSWDLVCDWEKDSFLAGYQVAAPQWISVKERLPEIGEWVLINGSEVCQRVAPPSSSWDWEFAWATDRHSFYEPTDITHWMPLPKPPEE